MALNQRLAGKGVKSFALHPGSIKSGLQKFMSEEMRDEALRKVREDGYEVPVRKTLQQGCATTLRATLDPTLEIEEGVYLVDCRIVGTGKDLMSYAIDGESAGRLWVVSEEMVGEKFVI